MIGNLEQICIAFYQGKSVPAYEAFQQMLPQIISKLEKTGQTGLKVLHLILDEVEHRDWVLVADYINFELIPLLQEG
ncbi:MAG: hypothetical protein J6I65_07425 [Lachnospiraceae bacterium]|nr:hypothetical protein [Lachnospiraceae bacterium]